MPKNANEMAAGQKSGAESGALQGNSAEQFAFVAKVWQRLPADFRAAIVRTARRGMNRLNTQGLAKVGK